MCHAHRLLRPEPSDQPLSTTDRQHALGLSADDPRVVPPHSRATPYQRSHQAMPAGALPAHVTSTVIAARGQHHRRVPYPTRTSMGHGPCTGRIAPVLTSSRSTPRRALSSKTPAFRRCTMAGQAAARTARSGRRRSCPRRLIRNPDEGLANAEKPSRTDGRTRTHSLRSGQAPRPRPIGEEVLVDRMGPAPRMPGRKRSTGSRMRGCRHGLPCTGASSGVSMRR